MYRFTLTMKGGLLHGRQYVMESLDWPPPGKIMGRDLAAYIPGTYLLDSHTPYPYEPVEDGLSATYALRCDSDYHRLLLGMTKHESCRKCNPNTAGPEKES